MEPESSGTSDESGGWPRPSFKWQFWQARELNRGPSPSEASVEDGADTQLLRKMPLPTLKSSSRLKSILPEESEKALAVSVEPREVAPPPGFCSPCFELGEVGSGPKQAPEEQRRRLRHRSEARRQRAAEPRRRGPRRQDSARRALLGDGLFDNSAAQSRDLEWGECTRPSSEADAWCVPPRPSRP